MLYFKVLLIIKNKNHILSVCFEKKIANSSIFGYIKKKKLYIDKSLIQELYYY